MFYNKFSTINIILIHGQGGKLGLKEDRFDVPFVFEGGELKKNPLSKLKKLLRWCCQALKKIRIIKQTATHNLAC